LGDAHALARLDFVAPRRSYGVGVLADDRLRRLRSIDPHFW
jgi:hypothetical protein